jgi:hypothetical protein
MKAFINVDRREATNRSAPLDDEYDEDHVREETETEVDLIIMCEDMTAGELRSSRDVVVSRTAREGAGLAGAWRRDAGLRAGGGDGC